MGPWVPQIPLSSYGIGMLLIQKTATTETCKCGTEVCLQGSTSETSMWTTESLWCLPSKVKSRHLSGTRLRATQDLRPSKHRSVLLVCSISWRKDVQVDQQVCGSHSLILDTEENYLLLSESCTWWRHSSAKWGIQAYGGIAHCYNYEARRASCIWINSHGAHLSCLIASCYIASLCGNEWSSKKTLWPVVCRQGCGNYHHRRM